LENTDISLLWSNFDKIMNRLPYPGILTVTGDNKGKENIITLGWIQLGIIWSKPVVSILVRPSRYSYQLLNKHNEFSVNVLSNKYDKEIAFCGANSGSYCDKFLETGLNKIRSSKINISSIKEADIIIECQTVHTTNVIPENLNDVLLSKNYPKGDYHTIFTGIILNSKINI
jgi:flavin reductase (DIM6/NTAB) family NADH-FMN oxidoreductase RutF